MENTALLNNARNAKRMIEAPMFIQRKLKECKIVFILCYTSSEEVYALGAVS